MLKITLLVAQSTPDQMIIPELLTLSNWPIREDSGKTLLLDNCSGDNNDGFICFMQFFPCRPSSMNSHQFQIRLAICQDIQDVKGQFLPQTPAVSSNKMAWVILAPWPLAPGPWPLGLV